MFGPFDTINFKKWIADNRDLLKPPVGNKCIWPQRDFFVMVVAGPNDRTDFHVNTGEEFYHQIEGDITLKVITPEGKMIDIKISEGDIYLLPPNTPHSPQRPANTIGLVIEKKRPEGLKDGLQWYCESCQSKLYEEFFILTNIETQFPAVFDRYYNSDHTLCKKCGTKNGRKWSHVKN